MKRVPATELLPLERSDLEDLRRAELISAALHVVAASGVGEATIRNIARIAGVSKGSIHYYFKSKEELLGAAFREHDRRFFDTVSKRVISASSVGERLHILAAACFPDDASASVEWSLIIEILQLADRHDAVRTVSDDAHAQWMRLVRDVIGEGIAAGELNATLDLELVANEFWALVDGLGFYIHGRLLDTNRAIVIVDSYLDGRLASPPAKSRPGHSTGHRHNIRSRDGGPDRSTARHGP